MTLLELVQVHDLGVAIPIFYPVVPLCVHAFGQEGTFEARRQLAILLGSEVFPVDLLAIQVSCLCLFRAVVTFFRLGCFGGDCLLDGFADRCVVVCR